MKKVFAAIALMIPIVLALGLGGCLLEDREIEIVLNDEFCYDFDEYHTTENYTTPAILELGVDLDSLLVDNDISRDQIIDVALVSGSYKIEEFSHTHDWEISGIITVERLDISGAGPDTLIIYHDISLEDELGIKTFVPLHADGVGIINQALDDYRDGSHPVLQVTVVNGAVGPTSPTVSDPLDFVWEACINVQVIATIETEIVNWLGGS
jgi:hypothetical protein